MKTFICGHCGRNIIPKPGDKLYRTCDTYVCNISCQRARVIAISKIDPKMENPLSWTYDLSSSPTNMMKRKSSMIGLQDLENGDQKIPVINTKQDERDDFDIATVTFDDNDLNLPSPKKPYEYIILTFAIIGSTLLLLTL
tara:strand:+ start:165 stop:584 length:420 start_codon:yes stop_codon:yes gene_type:complete